MKAKRLWSLWQALLAPFAACFTRRGWRRFVEWVTGLALNVEEHTITQSLVGIGRPGDWKALESFAEYGAWDGVALERTLARSLDGAPGRTWHGFHVLAGDDSKVHRTGKHVWGVCTFHEYSARCPNRAATVRAHNWVVVGALLHREEQPAYFVPLAGRLYFRKSQLPEPGGGPAVIFRTKNDLLVELARVQAAAAAGTCLLVFDGAFAVANVVRPLVRPEAGQPRVHFLTRLRKDARLYDIPLWPWDRPRRDGQMPRWGKRLLPPQQGGRWAGAWQEGTVFAYGRRRALRWKETLCLWRVAGHDVVVKAMVAEVEGYAKRFTLVTSASVLTGPQVVELFCARFRQEDGFRDLKQRLGWEECRAWTRRPIERTTQALFVTLAVLRQLEWALAACGEEDWWLRPPWNQRKRRPSVLDLGRLLREHGGDMRRLLAAWLGNERGSREEKAEAAGM
jgi:hypothetical protein